jgi:hypothetical protein
MSSKEETTAHEFYLKYWKVDGEHPTLRDHEYDHMKKMIDAYDHALKNGLEMRLMKFRGGKEKIVFVKP